MNHGLKKEILVLAGYINPDEPMSAPDSATSLRNLVARIGADKTTTLTTMALISSELAHRLDSIEGLQR